MKLSEWASIAEILASLAVVTTLIVLIVGVRENTEIVRASAYTTSLQDLNYLQVSILNDPDSMRVWTAFMNEDTEGFDNVDRQRFALILLSQFRTYESAYFSQKRGLLGSDEWIRFQNSICAFFERAVSDGVILGVIQRNTTEEFMGYVSDTCSG